MENADLVKEIQSGWDEVLNNVIVAAKKCGRNPADITIVAVSKTHPIDLIIAGMKAGIEVFGENYVQELKDKQFYIEENKLAQPKWHFIGHLQTNKVKYIASYIDLIHSVDSFKLAEEINKQAERNERMIDVLIQINTSGELTKSGCEVNEVFDLVESSSKLKNIKINGLMAIGSFSGDMNLVRSEFKMLADTRFKVKEKFPELNFQHLSMGMTGDYEIAIEEGATLIRVGTAIFGLRNYLK